MIKKAQDKIFIVALLELFLKMYINVPTVKYLFHFQKCVLICIVKYDKVGLSYLETCKPRVYPLHG